MFIRDTQGNGLDSLDHELLLSFILQKPRTWILAHPEYELTQDDILQWNDVVTRRKRGEPVAYITGKKEFYGRSFSVNASTLIPRPSTERLIENALGILSGETVATTIDADTDIVIATNIWGDIASVKTIADIGTGSGCIAVTLACEVPTIKLYATDISKDALEIAQKNAEHDRVSDRITFLQGDCLDPLAHIAEPFLIVSNPPYIPESTMLMKDVQEFEPHNALFSGEKGTDILEKLMAQAKAHPLCVGVIVECREEQGVMVYVD